MTAAFKLEGKQFGRWQVLKRVEHTNKGSHFLCRCACGCEKVVFGRSIANGQSKSCGCHRTDLLKARALGGDRKTVKAWSAAVQRCTNPNNPSWPDYGGRGIVMCEDWLNSFSAFQRDMGAAPPGMSLERIDNSKGYEPGNCKWATRVEQARNKRNNIYMEYRGERLHIHEWSKRTGISYDRLYWRYRQGWPHWKILGTPTPKSRRERDANVDNFG